MVSFQSECQQAEETGRTDVAVKERRQQKLIPQLEGSQVGEVPSYRRKRLGSNISEPDIEPFYLFFIDTLSAYVTTWCMPSSGFFILSISSLAVYLFTNPSVLWCISNVLHIFHVLWIFIPFSSHFFGHFNGTFFF